MESSVSTNHEQLSLSPQVSKERKAKGQRAFNSIAWNPNLMSALLSAITHLGNTGIWIPATHPDRRLQSTGPCHLETTKSLEGKFNARHWFAFNPPSS